MTYLELYARLVFVLTKAIASRGYSNAVGLPEYDDALSWPSRFGMEVARPLRTPFAKGDEPCIIGFKDSRG